MRDAMHIFRIRISRRKAAPVSFTGLFADSFEALLQALADWPDASGVSVICIRQRTAQ